MFTQTNVTNELANAFSAFAAWRAIDESEVSETLMGEEYLDHCMVGQVLSERIAKEIINCENFGGVVSAATRCIVALTPSAKAEGKWQVTTFSTELLPISDNGVMSLEDAAYCFADKYPYGQTHQGFQFFES